VLFRSPLILVGHARWGYCWAFPRGERVILGVGGLLRANPRGLRPAWGAFLAEMGVDPRNVSALRGFPIPCGNYLARPASGCALLVGDAAGLAHPLSGEGIYYAQRSGELAAEAIVAQFLGGPEAAGQYCAAVARQLHPGFRLANQLRGLVFRSPPALASLLCRGGMTLWRPQLQRALHGVGSHEREGARPSAASAAQGAEPAGG
jgi:menaquinone-9 beta-reductase